MGSRKRSEVPAQRVRLVRKFARVINDVDLALFQVGDVIRATEAVALMLIGERWAVLVPNGETIADP